MEAISQLVPFQFKNFVFTESFGHLAVKDLASHTRFTRKAIGQAWGAKNPQVYIDHLIMRHPDIGEGMEFKMTVEAPIPGGEPQSTVECGAKSHRSFDVLVKTHDAFDIYQMSICSKLARAKEFLKAFPEFLCAVCSGLVKPLPPDIYQIAQIPNYTHGKGKFLEQIARERGKSVASIRRMMNRVRRGEPLEKPHAKYIQTRYREKFEEAVRLKKENPNLRGYKIAQKIGVPRSVTYAWLRKDLWPEQNHNRKAA